jgi:energy-coupling factor transporter ATP-binding protein EcfA2
MRKPPDTTTSHLESNGAELPPPIYFLSLTVENVRCFGPRQTLDLSDGNDCPKQWTILLGDNGVGKTTLLQCLAGLQLFEHHSEQSDRLVLLPRLHQRSFDGYFMNNFFVGRTKELQFYINASLSVNANLISQRHGDKMTRWSVTGQVETTSSTIGSENLRGLVCYGYSANRRMGSTDLSETQPVDTIISLFDDNATLINPEEWLLQADYAAKSLEGEDQHRAEKRRDRIKEVLIRLLPDVSDLRFAPSRTAPIRTRVQAQTPYGWVSIRDMSLGYRTLMTWMVDFASRLFERYSDSPDPLAEPAIALVDEIDLHLHPRWQRTLMQFLSDMFPNTQFIASAHSPLIVQAATDANVVLLRREGNHVVIDNDVQAVKGWRVDQVLTSDLFSLESARPPQLDAALKERTKLLSKTRLTMRDKARLRELDTQIGSLPTGETPQDMKAMDIIRRAADLLNKQE